MSGVGPAARSPRSAAGTFKAVVLAVVARVPPGKVTTYGDVARLAGRPAAARAVGQIMRTAGRPGLPYHRVVAAGGRLGGYGNSPASKAALLRAEGVPVRGNRIAQFARYRWTGPGRRTQSPVGTPGR